MRRERLDLPLGQAGAPDAIRLRPDEIGVALRLLRGLLDCQIETTREIEAIMTGLLEAWGTNDQRLATAGELTELLTNQESRVLQQIYLGRTNRQIARMLGITEKTAKNYVQSIFRKLRVHSRTEAVLIAVRNQWFEPDVHIAEQRSREAGAKPGR